MRNKFFLMIIFFVLFAQYSFGQIPKTLSYQGILTDAGGNSLNGSFELTFRLYEVNQGGNSIWEEKGQVEIQNGLFETILGEQVSLNLPFDKQYWLGISVNGGAELSPRIQLTSSAYSLAANSIVGSGKVIRAINSLTDSVTIIGEGGAAVFTRNDTIIISAGNSGGGGIFAIQDPSAIPSLTITNPTGPTTNISVANAGILDSHIRFNQVVKTLNGLKENFTIKNGKNIKVETIAAINGNSDIIISALEDGGEVGGDLIVDGDLIIVVNGDTLTKISAGEIRTKGEIYAESLHIIVDGDTIAEFDSTGSRHFEPELYYDELELWPDQNSFPDETGYTFVNNDGELGVFAKEPSGATTKLLSFPDSPNGNFLFLNDVSVAGEVYLQSLHLLRQKAGSTTEFDTLTSFNSDGTSYHAGEETYAADIILEGVNTGLIFPDGTKQTSAAEAGGDTGWSLSADGDTTRTGQNLVIEDENGNIMTLFSNDGTSVHSGLETYNGGIKVGGPGINVVDGEGQTAISLGGEASGNMHAHGTITSGNSITINGVNHTINSDDPLEILVNNQRALRLEPNITSPNFLAGYSGNGATSGVFGAAIGGGAESLVPPTWSRIVTER